MTLEPGTQIPVVGRVPDEVDLFMFSASAWLLHRIHYDAPFATGPDGHQGLLVHGPLQGVYMLQAVETWLGPDARPSTATYRHIAPALVGERLECGGSVIAVDPDRGTFDAELWVRKADGTVTTEGTASFRMPPAV